MSRDEHREETGRDSRVEDWFGQSVRRDEELADELIEAGMEEQRAEREFAERATGEAEQERRHGDTIDPDQGRSAYRNESDDAEEDDEPAGESTNLPDVHERRPGDDPDSPGATIDDAEPAEPNEPG
jgi:hypothetical protein